MSKFVEQIKSLLGANPGLSAGFASGLIGATLPSVQEKNDFFTFFNFAPTGQKTQLNGNTFVTLKPIGEAFRSLVTLSATLSPGNKIQQLRLEVARDFIEDPKNCMYAADLVKSFLIQAQTSNADAIGLFATEIDARTIAQSSTVILSTRPPPPLKGPPSIAYGIYRGEAETQTLVNAAGSLQVLLQNITKTDSSCLELIMSAKFK